jgi:hypothetical protein
MRRERASICRERTSFLFSGCIAAMRASAQPQHVAGATAFQGDAIKMTQIGRRPATALRRRIHLTPSLCEHAWTLSLFARSEQSLRGRGRRLRGSPVINL